MDQQTEFTPRLGEAQPPTLPDYSQNQLAAAIKAAVQTMSKACKQEKVPETGAKNYIQNHYAGTQFALLYDFYQENDCDTLKLFIESLFINVEQCFHRHMTSKSQILKEEFNKQFGLVLGSLIKINNKMKNYYQWVNKVIEGVDLKQEIKEQAMRNQAEGKKILKQFYQVFVILDKCIGLFNKSEHGSNGVNSREQSTQTEIGKAYNPDKPYYSNETFAHESTKNEEFEETLKIDAATQTQDDNVEFTRKFVSLMELLEGLLKNHMQPRILNVNGYDVDILLGDELLDLIEDLHGKLDSNNGDKPSQAEFQKIMVLEQIKQQLMMNAQVVAEKLNQMQESFCSIANLKANIQDLVLSNTSIVITEVITESKKNVNDLMAKKYAQENQLLQRELERLIDRLKKAEANKQLDACRDPSHSKLEEQLKIKFLELEKLQDFIARLQEELTKAKEIQQGLLNQNDELKEYAKTIEKEREALLEGRKELEVGLKLLYANNEKLEEQLAGSHSLSKVVAEKEDEIKEMKAKYQAVCEDKEKFYKEAEEARNQIKRFKCSIEEMEEEYDLLRNKYELARSELVDSQQKTRREINELENKAQSLESQNKVLQKEVAELRAEKKDVLTMREELHDQTIRLEAENMKLRSEVVKSTNEKMKLEQELKKINLSRADASTITTDRDIDRRSLSNSKSSPKSPFEYPLVRQEKMLQNSTPKSKARNFGKKFTPLVRKGNFLLPALRCSPHSSSSSLLAIKIKQDTDDKENIDDLKLHVRRSSKELGGQSTQFNDQIKQKLPDLKDNQTPYETENFYISVSDLPNVKDGRSGLTHGQITSPNPKMKLLYSIKRILNEVNNNDIMCSEAKSNMTEDNGLVGSFDRYLHQKNDLNTPKSCVSEKDTGPELIDSALYEVEERIAKLELAAASQQKKSKFYIDKILGNERKIGEIIDSVNCKSNQEASGNTKTSECVKKGLVSCFDIKI